MSADDGRGAGKGEEFPADRGEDGLGVSSPQIGPADRAAEESVAGEEDGLGPFEQEAGGTGRVSRRVDRAQRGVSEADHLAVVDRGVRRKRRARRKPEETGLL